MINNPSQLLTLNAADRQHQLEREAALWRHTTPTRAVRSQRQSRIWIVIKDTPARIHAASARWMVTARRTRSSTVS